MKWILHNNFPIDGVAIIVIVIIIVAILFELVSFRYSACILVEICIIVAIFNPKYLMFRLVVESKVLVEIQLLVLDVHDLFLDLTDVFHLSKKSKERGSIIVVLKLNNVRSLSFIEKRHKVKNLCN